jgi:hypothetical protein
MKASELIQRLNELIAEHGDRDIVYPDNSERSYGPLEADEVDEYEHWDHKTIQFYIR